MSDTIQKAPSTGANWSPNPSDQQALESHLKWTDRRRVVVPWVPEYGYLEIGPKGGTDGSTRPGDVLKVLASAQHGKTNGDKIVTLYVGKGAVGKIGCYLVSEDDRFVPGPDAATDSDADREDTPVQSDDPRVGEDDDEDIFKSDPDLTLRERITRTNTSVVIVRCWWENAGTKIDYDPSEVEHEWFRSRAAAADFVIDMVEWATKDEPDDVWVLIQVDNLAKVQEVVVCNVVDATVRASTAKYFKDFAEADLWPAPKKKAPRKATVVKTKKTAAKKEAPKVKAPGARRATTPKQGMEVKPKAGVIRSKGTLAKKRPTTKPKAEITAKAQAVRARMRNQNRKAVSA